MNDFHSCHISKLLYSVLLLQHAHRAARYCTVALYYVETPMLARSDRTACQRSMLTNVTDAGRIRKYHKSLDQ